jgi:hypothetical protein
MKKVSDKEYINNNKIRAFVAEILFKVTSQMKS